MSLSPVSPTGKKLKTMDDDQGGGLRSGRQQDRSDKINHINKDDGNQAGTQGAIKSDSNDKGRSSNSTKNDREPSCANKGDLKDEPPMRPTTSSHVSADKLNNPTHTKSSSKPSKVESQPGNNQAECDDSSDVEHGCKHDQDEDELDDVAMHSSDIDALDLAVIGDDFAESDTTGHSVDQDDFLEIYSNEDSIEDLILVGGSASDSDESSGYMGYENAVAGRYYYDHDDDSLDEESDEEEDLDIINHCSPEEYLKYDPTPDNPYPKPDWTTLNELMARKRGFTTSRNLRKRQNMFWFERYASNSLWMIQRLQVVRKLNAHTGCVNSLGFNSSANLICSGSDDLDVCIWDWQKDSNQLKAEIPTGHHNNVFQSVFCNRDTNIVTSSRDGSVRLIDIETRQTEKLMSSTGEIQKLAFISEDTFLTCGTNAFVDLIDLRTRDTKRLFTVRSPKTNLTCQLHSINSHPLDKHVIAVAGKSPYVFLYDLRRLPRELHDPEIKPTYSLGNLDNSSVRVTSTAFNSTGDKLLISYNDDDLYVCRTDTCEVIHKYQGHRNKKTYKGCAWFGDNFVLSGSDDGHIYGWDLESEHIVCFLKADSGIVNCLLVHPTLPMIASSGLENNVKIWEPIAAQWPQTMKGIKPQICKNTMRRKFARSRFGG